MNDWTVEEKPSISERLPEQVNWLHKTNNLHPACYNCIKRRIAENDAKVAVDGELKYKKGDFIVKCTGIPLDYSKTVPETTWNTWSVSEQETFLEISDPVYWAEKYLDWSPRVSKTIPGLDYQSVLLRCSAARKQSRIGRRAGKTNALAVSSLHFAYTHYSAGVTGKRAAEGDTPSGSVLILTPYGNQIDIIFKEIRALLNRSPVLVNSVVRDVSNPNKIEFANGNTITGLTAGVKSGAKAGSARGQGAGYILFDEMDFIDNESIDNVLVIAGESKSGQVWASSTPTGSRDSKFYANYKNPFWAEFHFPSWVSPKWNVEIETEFRETLDRFSYMHEVEALWGEQSTGVFLEEFIRKAYLGNMYLYGPGSSPQFGKKPGWIYTMGVDWNENTGNQIVIVGLDPLTKHCYVVDRGSIEDQNFQQALSVQKIIELNRKWHCDHIYIDRGHGNTQYEYLQIAGRQAREALLTKDKSNIHAPIDAKLVDIVKAVDFQQSTITFAPVTREEIKKPTKPLMVQNTMRWFESGRISFPESDLDLRAQLGSYILVRITPTGQPVYASRHPDKIGDHIIDALFLALWAIEKEYSTIGSGPQYNVYAAIGSLYREQERTSSLGPGLIEQKKINSPIGELSITESKRSLSSTDERSPQFNRVLGGLISLTKPATNMAIGTRKGVSPTTRKVSPDGGRTFQPDGFNGPLYKDFQSKVKSRQI